MELAMVRIFVHNLGEHSIDRMVVSGPCREIIMTMAEMFLATYGGPPHADLDYAFARYIIDFSMGQGRILEYHPAPPEEIN
jgi:hypothetical protein